METGGPSAIELIFWILAANAVLILAAVGLVMLLNRKSLETVRAIGEEIQAHAARLDSIAGFLQEYASIEQEPFSTPLDELQKEATELQDRLQHFLQVCRAFEDEGRASGNNQLQDIINAPINAFRRWRHSQELRRESTEIAGQLAAAENRVQRIYELPWELSTQSRQVDKDVSELIQIARDLQAKGVRGNTLQTLLDQIPQLERSLEQIPRPFLESDHNELLASANLDSTIRVFEVLNRTRPIITRYLPQAREWQAHAYKASVDYAELKQSGASLRQSLAQPPEGLSIVPLQTRLDHVAQLAGDLAQRIAQPEVENLKPLSREVARLRKVIQDTEQQFARAGRQIDELTAALEEISAALEKTSTQFKTLERSENYPLILDESSPVLAALQQRLEALGPAKQPRTPEQIALHLKEIEGIRVGQSALAEKAPRISEQHHNLVALLESAEILDGAAWFRKTREMGAQTAVYDPRNWPKQDSISTFASEVEELANGHQTLAPADNTRPIQESELSQRLKQTQQLAAQHKAMRLRAESIRMRLEKLKTLEEEGKEKLTGSWTALERVAILAESNPILESIAAADIERLGEEIRQFGNELNTQSQGEVEKKLQKINTQTEKVTRALNGWLSHLNAAVVERGKKVQERLAQVEAAATLEDTAVQEARSLLAREDFTAATVTVAAEKTNPISRISSAARGALTEREPALGTLEVTGEIKRKNDLWQNLLGVQTALDEKSGPVLLAYQEVVQARNQARDNLTELGALVPEGKRSWPPSNQSPLPENQALQPVDDRWEAMRKQHGRSEWAIQEMKRLVQQYSLISERARQLFERARQDQDRVQELEWQIEDLKQRWQSQIQADPNNPVVREGVRQLMSQTDSRLSYIKHQYMRSAISYEQVIQNLQLLNDELFASRVSVDEQTDIGLNEVPRQSQPSSGPQINPP